MMKNGLREGRISPGAIANIVKQPISKVGCDPSCYSGHSLRAGFTTEAARLGVPKWSIKAQTGHASNSALERYIRDGELLSSDAPNVLAASAARDASNEADTPKAHSVRLQRVARALLCTVMDASLMPNFTSRSSPASARKLKRASDPIPHQGINESFRIQEVHDADRNSIPPFAP